ncbi:hypothetical protein INS49_014487 [Diaporthe citri]|uniref:uncharacterized protein n=1 Tax=Diaporthe citri TaxID=83186 RepID=UPI001C7F78F8|nr:uncharacterized protein INS49_014487 [Diaporthe citri]KAG6356614.1 hypothetical protein INS49_014487 [Diaporthe citri]
MTRPFAMLLPAALVAAVMAAPGLIEQAHPVAHRSTPTTCMTGAQASTSGYVLNYTAVEDSAAGNRFYDIAPGFNTDHSVGSAMNLPVAHGDDANAYASFKCQFTCNATPGCVSFFGRFVQVNSTSERFECLGFDTLLDDSSFTASTGNMANGGFNKLCD